MSGATVQNTTRTVRDIKQSAKMNPTYKNTHVIPVARDIQSEATTRRVTQMTVIKSS